MVQEHIDHGPTICPICGNQNNCGYLLNKLATPCWCSKEFFPKKIINRIPVEQRNKACICRSCFERFAES